MLPLDLHVLSLELAFILSQDQTLHRRFLFSLFLVPDAVATGAQDAGGNCLSSDEGYDHLEAPGHLCVSVIASRSLHSPKGMTVRFTFL